MTRMLSIAALSMALAVPAHAAPKRSQQSFGLDELIALADQANLDKALRKAGLKDAGQAVDFALAALSGDEDMGQVAAAWIEDATRKGKKGKRSRKGRKGKVGKKSSSTQSSSKTTTTAPRGKRA